MSLLPWLETIISAQPPRPQKSHVREASDDHFYGPWKGGSKAAGGRPEKPYGEPHTDDYLEAFSVSLNGDASPYAAGTTYEDRLGNCYQYAGGFALMSKDQDANLIHGSIAGFGNPRIDHAWAEVLGPDGTVQNIYEPASNNLWPPKAFQAYFSAEVKERYSREDAMTNMLKHEHWGPWDR